MFGMMAYERFAALMRTISYPGQLRTPQRDAWWTRFITDPVLGAAWLGSDLHETCFELDVIIEWKEPGGSVILQVVDFWKLESYVKVTICS